MRLLNPVCFVIVLLAALPVWSQEQPAAPAAAGPLIAVPVNTDNGADRMLTPPPVSGQTYPTASASEERSNYLRGGLSFNGAYSDNVVGLVNGHPESDISYSVWPWIALDETTPRLHWVLNYAPGFTFYQRTSSRNEMDQNASVEFEYRMSPHVTLSARDGFQKSSSVFNQPNLGAAGAVSGGIQEPNQSVIAPVADRLGNFGTAGITYQFAANSMIGAGGTFSNLHYPNPAEVPGLFDSASQGGSAFYSLRVSRMNYFGATYQYQRLLSYPAPGTNQTQTHALLLFYTLYATPKFSISIFGGPQYSDSGQQFSDTAAAPTLGSRSWNPAAGGSLSWQGRLSNLAISYSHMISSGGGLVGAVRMDGASASVRQQLSRTLSASVMGAYAQNDVLTSTPLFDSNGHTVSGTASLQQQFGQHLNLQLGYTRVHQDYSTVTVLAATPNTNREFVTLTYQFSRPLGR
ncbi:MAG: hypothetical protein WB562_14935 [Candidatus Sulfotelmatobacter sp.]